MTNAQRKKVFRSHLKKLGAQQGLGKPLPVQRWVTQINVKVGYPVINYRTADDWHREGSRPNAGSLLAIRLGDPGCPLLKEGA